MLLTLKLRTELFETELFICIKIDLALNNRQRLICHKTPTNKQTIIAGRAGDKEICTIFKGISPKVNITAQLDFELTYCSVTFRHVSHHATQKQEVPVCGLLKF